MNNLSELRKIEFKRDGFTYYQYVGTTKMYVMNNRMNGIYKRRYNAIIRDIEHVRLYNIRKDLLRSQLKFWKCENLIKDVKSLDDYNKLTEHERGVIKYYLESYYILSLFTLSNYIKDGQLVRYDLDPIDKMNTMDFEFQSDYKNMYKLKDDIMIHINQWKEDKGLL
eukprot:Lithocolla_globosa_v1_NODE_9021_length_756_cov_6.761769.p1 type:complete len:167 gc:universal NODE_9021_length_756_cov_6.761769:705-205(-)